MKRASMILILALLLSPAWAPSAFSAFSTFAKLDWSYAWESVVKGFGLDHPAVWATIILVAGYWVAWSIWSQREDRRRRERIEREKLTEEINHLKAELERLQHEPRSR